MLLVRTADQILLIFILIALPVISGSFFNPASSAAIPSLVLGDQLFVANALSNSTRGVLPAAASFSGEAGHPTNPVGVVARREDARRGIERRSMGSC